MMLQGIQITKIIPSGLWTEMGVQVSLVLEAIKEATPALGNEVGVNCSLNTVQLALAAGDVSPSKNDD